MENLPTDIQHAVELLNMRWKEHKDLNNQDHDKTSQRIIDAKLYLIHTLNKDVL